MERTQTGDFLVRRDDLRRHTFAETPAPETSLEEGEALLRVDAFALTANNVTYGAFGDALHYWDFFPAPEGWGRIPAWGFATVIASAQPGIVEGARYYGYVPMSSSVAMRPQRVTATTFTDGAPHRAALHPLYNNYTLAPAADATSDALQLLLRPLFITSFILDDFFAEAAYYGATQIAVSSASSKTAYGMAFLMAARLRRAGSNVRIAGLTSARNVAFVASLGCYDDVFAYEELARLPAFATLFVDFAANDEVTRQVHTHLGAALAYSSAIGATHWEARGTHAATSPLPGPAPVPFFAPAQIKQRVSDWGPGGFAERFDAAWATFVAAIRARGSAWLAVTRGSGPEALATVYDAAIAGTLSPGDGHILTLSD